MVDRLAGEQASEIARTLAMASETPLDRGDAAELNRIGANLMKNRAILAVVFFDAQGNVLSSASRDAEMERGGSGVLGQPALRRGAVAAAEGFVALARPLRAADGAGDPDGPRRRPRARSRRARPPRPPDPAARRPARATTAAAGAAGAAARPAGWWAT